MQNMTIGERIHQLLKDKNLKQTDLAKKLNTRPSTINGWKKEKTPSSNLIIPICEFLNVSPEFLLTGTESELSAEDRRILRLYKELPDTIKQMIDVAFSEIERQEKSE